MFITRPLDRSTGRRWAVRAATPLILFGMLAGSALGSPPAHAQEQADGDALVSLMHGKCIEAEDTPGAPSMPRVRMWQCSPTNANQRWTYSAVTGEFRTYRNKCLDAYAMERLDPVIVYPCTGGKNQKWDMDSRGRIVLRGVTGPGGDRYCITIASGDRSDGARLWLQYCHRGENQLFYRDPTGGGGSTVSIESDLGGCVDTRNRVEGTRVWLWQCFGPDHANQRWRRTAEMEFRLEDTAGTARVLCLDGGSGASRAALTVEVCNDRASQKWNTGANGEIQLQNGQKPCLHVPGESNHNGNELVVSECFPVVLGGQRWSYRDPRPTPRG